MKKHKILLFFIIISIILSSSVFSLSTPSPTNEFYINDFAGVLSESTKNLIMKNSVSLQQQTGAQIVVVTLSSLEDSVLEDLSLDILRSWGIGDSKANNGVLMLLAVNDRKSRIEVGYGLEGALPDGKTGRIQDDYMLPYFIINDYDEGIKNGYLAILNEVALEYSLDISSLDKPYLQVGTVVQEEMHPILKIIIGFLVLLLLIFDWVFLNGRITRTLIMIVIARGGGGRGGGSGGFGGGGFRGGGGSGGGGGSSRGW